ncbi:Histone deacetylase 2 [Geodia barretti]|uniref:Histone deacetylase 2 n=1 Tax=Geodia barretti TaxID=519541 RepID=A0AA35TZG5_GEOBA|nr:Histone deacetylase 2 [Geodia barretti]
MYVCTTDITSSLHHLYLIPHAPSVPMQSIPEDMIQDPEPTEDDPDERIPQHVQDKMIAREEDLSDSEDEGDGRRNESVGHHDNKRLRLADEGGDNKAPAVNKITTGGGSIQSPVPPEPSPITPSPLVTPHSQESKAETAQEKTAKSASPGPEAADSSEAKPEKEGPATMGETVEEGDEGEMTGVGEEEGGGGKGKEEREGGEGERAKPMEETGEQAQTSPQPEGDSAQQQATPTSSEEPMEH